MLNIQKIWILSPQCVIYGFNTKIISSHSIKWLIYVMEVDRVLLEVTRGFLCYSKERQVSNTYVVLCFNYRRCQLFRLLNTYSAE
jgi:hypothetical protein